MKVELYALMDKQNLHSALCYFTCMYCSKLVMHSNQIKLPMASSVDYIISWMSLPFCKVLSSCTGTQNFKNIHMKCFPRVHLTSLALEKTTFNLQKSIPLRYVNIIMTESIRPLWEIMLTFFQFQNPQVTCATFVVKMRPLTKFGQ